MAPFLNPVFTDIFDGNLLDDNITDGTTGDDNIVLDNGNDTSNGLDGDDLISGNGGNDTISGGGGNDALDGGAGTDTATYTVSLTKEMISKQPTFWQVATGTSEGTDQLINVEIFDGAEAGKFLLVGGGGFATIQAAINAASAGDTVIVAAGTYSENLIVTKSLTILGANAGISGSGTRGAESTLTGNITIAANGITVDGMAFNGGASAIRGESGANAYDNLTIRNNLIQNTTDSAIRLGLGNGGGIGSDNWTITNNKIDNIVGNALTGMVLFNVDGLTVTGNVINHTNSSSTGRRGINLDGVLNATVSNNTIDLGLVSPTDATAANTAAPWIVQLSMSDRAISNVTVSNNTVSGANSGIIGLSQRSMVNVDITGNTVSNVVSGIVLNTGGTAPVVSGVTMDVDVTGNTVSAATNAIFVRDLHDAASNGPVTFTGLDVTGNTINSGVVQIGRLESSQPAADGLLNITGATTIDGSANNDTVQVEGSGTVTFNAGDGNDTFIGGTGNDTINGDAGNDTLSGGDGNDQISGNGGNDTIGGGAGDDNLEGGAGDDNLEGGAGTDTAIYTGNFADYTITGLANNFTIVNNLDDLPDGTDTVQNVEFLQFADVTVPVANILTTVRLFDNNDVLIGGFTTIQEAIDAAADGYRILVGAGSYTENLTVNKSLTIRGANTGIAASDTRGAESVLTGGIHILDEGVLIDGMKIAEGTTISGELAGVYVQANNATVENTVFHRSGTVDSDGSRGVITAAGSITGLGVSGNSFSGFATGVYLKPGAAGSVSGNSFEDNFVGLSFDTNNPADVAVTGNSFTNNLFEQVGLGILSSTANLLTFGSGSTFTGASPQVSIYGLRGDGQLIIGTGFDDKYSGGAGNDTISGGAGNDTLIGGAGTDTLTGGAGTNSLDGDAGIDTATFAGNYADYTLAFSGSNVVVTQVVGGSIVDTVTDIEKLQFADKAVIVVGSAVGSEYTTIAQGIAAANANEVVLVAAGTYSEDLMIRKSLTLRGAQAGVKATGLTRSGGETIINGTGNSSSFVVTIEANDVTIDGFSINPRNPARDGINTRTNATSTKPGDPSVAYRANVAIRNNWIYSSYSTTAQLNGIVFGESTDNATKSVNAEIANVSIADNYINLVTSAASSGPRGMVFTNMFRDGSASLLYSNLLISGNTVFATNVPLVQPQLRTRLDGATITGNTFGNSRGTGVSIASTMTNSTFSNNTIQDVSAGSGAWLSLVNSTASNNTFQRIGGAAFVLSGGKSSDPTYYAPSANSTISNNTINYNDVALPVGSTQATGLNIQPNLDSAAVSIPGTTGVDANTITLSGNTFINGNVNSSVAVAAIAQRSVGKTLNAVNATPNVFNGVSLTGSTTTDQLFAIADQLADVVDATNLGAVTISSGNVYVTPSSFWSPSTTTTADVQRAVSAAGAGQTVWVKTGAYTPGTATTAFENLTVNAEAGVTGFTGLVLDTGVANGTLAGTGSINLTGNAGDNVLTGNDGANLLQGNGGNDALAGGTGNDALEGGAG
ncbi:beta strand repeat-containing protein, partial [Microcystis sp.]|uniref:beta strand repeat-containing protein n=2 Tax=Microcystis sp. TaxID=1127 RepID=UPI00391CB100